MAGLKNTTENFGWVSIGLHWLMAIALITMYFVGDWMVGLEYYDKWYKSAPDLHKSFGVIVGGLMLERLVWNQLQLKPQNLDPKMTLMNNLASAAHYFLYLLVFVIVASGYLISTAKGQGIEVFGLFEIPAVLPDNAERGELAGDIHKFLALGFMLLVAVHALAALVHHIFIKDSTLKRMLGVKH